METHGGDSAQQSRLRQWRGADGGKWICARLWYMHAICIYIYIYSLSLEKKSADADSAREDRSSKPVVVDLVLDKGSIYRARRLGAVLPAPRKLQWAATGNVCVR